MWTRFGLARLAEAVHLSPCRLRATESPKRSVGVRNRFLLRPGCTGITHSLKSVSVDNRRPAYQRRNRALYGSVLFMKRAMDFDCRSTGLLYATEPKSWRQFVHQPRSARENGPSPAGSRSNGSMECGFTFTSTSHEASNFVDMQSLLIILDRV